MQTYILLTKLSANDAVLLKERKTIGRKWLEQVKDKCPEVRFIDHYALLGDYDFLDIYQAPDNETAAMISLISKSAGAETAISMPAIPYKNFLKLTEEL
ncbi:MAG: hypothetical protein Kow00127_09110 [Bacteroidales bacterium]